MLNSENIETKRWSTRGEDWKDEKSSHHTGWPAMGNGGKILFGLVTLTFLFSVTATTSNKKEV